MNRRQVLASAGSLLGAGCIGDGQSSSRSTTPATAADAKQSPTTTTATPQTPQFDTPAGAWPMYQGNARNTGTTGTATPPSASVTEAWTFDAAGHIKGAPIVADGTLYLTSTSGMVYALDPSDGSELWTYDAGGRIDSAPAVAGDTLFVGTGNDELHAITMADGSRRWVTGVNGNTIASPVVDDDTVYINTDGTTTYAIRTSDGSSRWQQSFRFAARGAPAVADGRVYLITYGTHFRALDTETGSQLDEERFFVGNRSSLTLTDGRVFIGHNRGVVRALWPDGDRSWIYQTEGESTIASTPAVADGETYFTSFDGHVYATEAGSLQWTNRIGNSTRPRAPLVANGVVITADHAGFVAAYDRSDGTERWRVDLPERVDAELAAGDGYLYVGDVTGRLHAFTEA